jgi:TRAP-type C4-dicarboxylate transport system permease small subunit
MASIIAGYNRVLNWLYALAGIIIFTIFLLIVSDVVIVAVGLQPWLMSSVLVEYGLLWFAMLAAPQLVRTKGHVFIDAITQLLPARIQYWLAKLVYVICIASSLTFCGYSAQLLIVAFSSGEVDIRAVDMPLWLLLAPLPFTFALVALEFGRYLVGIDDMYGSRTDARDTV